MSTFGVAIPFICRTISLLKRENSIFSSKITKITSKKQKGSAISLTYMDLIRTHFELRELESTFEISSIFQYAVWEEDHR